MAKPFSQFQRDMAELAVTVQGNASRIMRQVALAADQSLVLATPVDTGRARSNWQMSIGEPIRETREPYALGAHGSTAAANVNAVLEQARQALSKHKIGFPIYLTNNLEYIGDLNSGSSAQAPANFIPRALQAAVAAFANSGIRITQKRFA